MCLPKEPTTWEFSLLSNKLPRDTLTINETLDYLFTLVNIRQRAEMRPETAIRSRDRQLFRLYIFCILRNDIKPNNKERLYWRQTPFSRAVGDQTVPYVLTILSQFVKLVLSELYKAPLLVVLLETEKNMQRP